MPDKVNNSGENVSLPPDMDVNLDDDKAPNSKEFNGATLSMDSNDTKSEEANVEFRGTQSGATHSNTMPDMSGNEPGLTRDRPFSASTRSRMSTKSMTSLNPGVVQTDFTVRSYFAYRQGIFEAAVEQCQSLCINEGLDGALTGAWLLTSIDHWDNEREKVVLITEHSLLMCRYDFIACRLVQHRRIMLHNIDTIMIGDFVYPPKSLMPPRRHGGIKVQWNKGRVPTFAEKWNPSTSDIGFTMFAHHPIIYHQKENETVTYNVDDFCESLIQAINQALKVKNPGQNVKVVEEPILIESYASLSSMVFNQSSLGFFKERGGVSF